MALSEDARSKAMTEALMAAITAVPRVERIDPGVTPGSGPHRSCCREPSTHIIPCSRNHC